MQLVKKHLLEKGHDVLDLGMTSPEEPHYFYETAPRVAKAILNDEAENFK